MDTLMTFPDTNHIKDQAALWVVKLQGYTYKDAQGIPAEDAAALRVWLNQSDLHQRYFTQTLAAWDAMGMLEELADIMPLSELSMPSAESSNNRAGHAGTGGLFASLGSALQGFSLARSGVALSFSVALLWGLLTLVPFLSPPSGVYQTGIGERASYTLADGSVLTLNTNSEVSVDFSSAQREVMLRRGEVNFDVAKDTSRPFVVYAGQGLVWAVGTAFNVRHTDGYVGVLVSEGVVKVFSGVSHQAPPALKLNPVMIDPGTGGESLDASAKPQSQALLVAGEEARFGDTILAQQVVEPSRMEKRLAWQQGVLHFEGETLQEAMGEIARYTDYQLVIVDASIRDTRVGGRFKTDDIDALLGSLAKSLNIKMTEQENGLLLFSAQ